MSESIIKNKSFLFAIRIVKLYQLLTSERKEYVLSKQLLRSGTSIGANVREALNGESKADFIHKLAISQKECDESMYWFELLKATNYITEAEFESINQDASELLKILKSIIITTKSKK
ncbi:four helix bundle protein [Flavobacterium ovatum]|uniref:four helix bundle protein n=1 Tax=Flavobacterium ovatum TaxID=1928857 RepID=UPI00344F6C83